MQTIANSIDELHLSIKKELETYLIYIESNKIAVDVSMQSKSMCIVTATVVVGSGYNPRHTVHIRATKVVNFNMAQHIFVKEFSTYLAMLIEGHKQSFASIEELRSRQSMYGRSFSNLENKIDRVIDALRKLPFFGGRFKGV